jgi:hypothetical protein
MNSLTIKKFTVKFRSTCVSMFPRLDLPFYLVVDSSAQGIGYVLNQKHAENLGEKMHVIKFGSKSLIHWQKSYETSWCRHKHC